MDRLSRGAVLSLVGVALPAGSRSLVRHSDDGARDHFDVAGSHAGRSLDHGCSQRVGAVSFGAFGSRLMSTLALILLGVVLVAALLWWVFIEGTRR
jgi:hypothetical protein